MNLRETSVKYILKQCDVSLRLGFIWLKIVVCEGLLCNTKMHKMLCRKKLMAISSPSFICSATR
jgi:hypothetical protein